MLAEMRLHELRRAKELSQKMIAQTLHVHSVSSAMLIPSPWYQTMKNIDKISLENAFSLFEYNDGTQTEQ